METDYQNYSLVSTCIDLAVEHIEFFYFLIRDRKWPEENEEKWKSLLDKVKNEFKLSTDNLIFSNQTDCPLDLL